jgi:ribosomal protein S16
MSAVGTAEEYQRSVFINAPFDIKFAPLFDAITFTIIDCGFKARCALEVDNGAQVRLDKIYKIIEECKLSVHDLSRVELDATTGLPRFNMPFELGLFLGARRFGSRKQKTKNCIILDKERFRYQKFISDIAGHDPREHGNRKKLVVKVVRDWLTHEEAPERQERIPGAEKIEDRLNHFKSELPIICKSMHINERRIIFKEKVELMFNWCRVTPISVST